MTLVVDWIGYFSHSELDQAYGRFVADSCKRRAGWKVRKSSASDQAAQKRRATFERESEMPDFDVETFVNKLDRMGMKLTAVPLADGKLRVNRWRMLNASEHTQQIQDLWAMQIGNDQERIDLLATHLAKAAPQGFASK